MQKTRLARAARKSTGGMRQYLLSSRQFRRRKCFGNPHEIRTWRFLSYRFLSKTPYLAKLECFEFHPIASANAAGNSNDPVQPGEGGGAGFESQHRAKVIKLRVDTFALAEARDDIGGPVPESLARNLNEVPGIGSQRVPGIKHRHPIWPDDLPVGPAAEHGSRHSRSADTAAYDVDHPAVTDRGHAEIERVGDLDLERAKRRELGHRRSLIKSPFLDPA